MNTKRTTGFGLHDKSRQIARRWQDIIDRVENLEPLDSADHAARRLAREALPRRWQPFVGTLKRPLAA